MKPDINKLKKTVKQEFEPAGVGHISRKAKRLSVIAVLAVIIAAVALIYMDQKTQKSYEFFDSDNGDNSSIQMIRYNGKDYEYNNQIFAFLLIGTDGRGKMHAEETYGDKDRADNIMLIILDNRNKRVKVLPISRDTMCYITRYSKSGYDEGSYIDHLGYAFSYGDGGKESCRNTCEAVSNLLYGVDIRTYVAANLDSLPYVSDLIGSVTVTVPNDDLSSKYPEFKKGNTAKVVKSNIEDFLRYRDTKKVYSNNGRMQRQQAFAEGAVKKIKYYSEDEIYDLWSEYEENMGEGGKYEGRFISNLTRTQFIKYVSMISEFSYVPERDNLQIYGKNKMENGYDVFYPSEEKLKELVIETFYIER